MVSDNGGVSRTQSPASTRRWWIIGGLLITAFSALIIALGIYLNHDKVRWTVTDYEVVDDRTVTVGFDVHRPAQTAVVCRVRAVAPDFAVVGTVDVTIPADRDGGAATVHEDVTIRTTTRATTGSVFNCVTDRPERS